MIGRFTLMRPPALRQNLLLAAFHPDRDVAARAAERWSAAVDLDKLDFTSLHLLPMLAIREEPLPLGEHLAHQVKNVTRMTWLRTESHARLVAPTIGRLVEAGLDPVLLKGAALIYGHGMPARLRPMWDFDVLVDAAQLGRATQALLDAGLVARDQAALLADEQRIRAQKHSEEFRGAGGEEVDLHWAAISTIHRPEIPPQLRRRTVTAKVAGVACQALGRTDLLAVTLAHAVEPMRTLRERWVGDCVMLVRGHEHAIDWELLARRGSDWRLAHQVVAAFDYLSEVAGVELPPQTRRALGRAQTPLALRVRARHERRESRGVGSPAGRGRLTRLIEDYEIDVADRVPLGQRTGAGDFLDFLVDREGLGSRGELPGELLFRLTGRPWRTRRRLRALLPGRERQGGWPAYDPGTRLRFGGELPATDYLGAGWWFPEDFGTWSRGAHSRLGLRLETPISGGARLELGVYGLIGDGHERVEVDVVVNEFRLVTFAFDRDNQAQELVIAVPSEVISGRGEATIDFVVRHPAVPAEIGTAPDMRQIGFGLGWLALVPASRPATDLDQMAVNSAGE